MGHYKKNTHFSVITQFKGTQYTELRDREHWTQDMELRHGEHWTQDTELRHREHWTQDTELRHTKQRKQYRKLKHAIGFRGFCVLEIHQQQHIINAHINFLCYSLTIQVTVTRNPKI